MEPDEKPNERANEAINYQALFIIGITFMGTGSALTITIGPAMLGLTAMGIVFMTIGLANR